MMGPVGEMGRNAARGSSNRLTEESVASDVQKRKMTNNSRQPRRIRAAITRTACNVPAPVGCSSLHAGAIRVLAETKSRLQTSKSASGNDDRRQTSKQPERRSEERRVGKE